MSSDYRTTKDEERGPEDRLLTVVEAAHFLNLAPGTVYRLICQQRIPVVHISSRCVRFSRAALQEWIESLSQNADEFSDGDRKSAPAIRKLPNAVHASGRREITKQI
jgi:excisionase family DNA binding protein